MEKIFLWTNPTNPTALTVVLPLIFVKQVANTAVIFSKQCATVFTSLLGLEETSSVIVLAAPRPLRQVADAIFPRRRRHLLLLLLHHLPLTSHWTFPPAWKPRLKEAESVGHPLLLGAAATRVRKGGSNHVICSIRISGPWCKGWKPSETLSPSSTLVAVVTANGSKS